MKKNDKRMKISRETIRQIGDLNLVVGGDQCDTTSVTTEAPDTGCRARDRTQSGVNCPVSG